MTNTCKRLIVQGAVSCFVAMSAFICATAIEGQQTQHLNHYDHMYRKLWLLVEKDYLWRNRLSDWSQWEHKFDGKLHSLADEQAAAKQLMASLDDDYSYVLDDGLKKKLSRERASTGDVSIKVLPNNVGYIAISTFEALDLDNQVASGLKKLRGVDSYILDLRGNRGGLVQRAFDVFSMFIDEGRFTSYRGFKSGGSDEALFDLTKQYSQVTRDGNLLRNKRLPNLTGNKPIIVLVNSDTRSAAEMVAGALRDNGRATLLGTKTFGKGVLQNVQKMEDGTLLKLTTAKYFLPKGENIHGVGIEPDIIVASGVDGKDEQLQRARRILESEQQLSRSQEAAAGSNL